MNTSEFKRKILPLNGSMYMAALRITGSVADAEDVVQDVCLRLWERRKSLDGVENLSAYVVTMVRHRALDMMSGGDRGRSTADSDQMPDRESDTDASSALESAQEVRRLLDAIDKLPDKESEIIKLKHIEGLEMNDIVTATGLSAGNIRVILFRARNHIRKLLNH